MSLCRGLPEQVVRHVFNGGEVGRSVVCSDPAFVVTEDHVHDPVQAVLDCPMASDDQPEKVPQHDQRCDVIARLSFDLAAEFTRAFNDGDSVQAWPFVPISEPFDIMDHGGGPSFDATIIGVDRLCPADLRIDEVSCLRLVEQRFNIFAQRSLIAFQPKNIIGLLLDDLSRDGALTTHRIDGDDRPLDRQQVQQFRDRDDLIGFFGDLDLSQHEALARGEGEHHMDGAFSGLSTGPTHGLAIDRDHAHPHAGQRRDPGDEAALELLRVEGGEEVAEMIVRRGSIAARPEPPQKIELLLTKAGDLNTGFGSGQHREQRQQNYLVKRIRDLATLTWIRQIIEMIEKYNLLEESLVVLCRVVHGHPPLRESGGSS